MNIEEFPSDASDAIFRALLEAAPDAMVVADGVGEIILANAQTENYLVAPGRS